ncbi:hypothetical protein K402DRAFT_375823 [Aulographum hederae CBS 113979]|uniref:Uncharacterized protein n=1 Tax=Aulographum hederae CBS 113979 TaxID=1176131 RepID=A0A6G1H2G8_9PEZI|nr:hypothetical protein K402DRAFT_375823 [Aulographum hederae CBS 113979]
MLQYFNLKKGQKHPSADAEPEKSDAKSPVLNEEDEQFLQNITSDDSPPPPLPKRPTMILDNGQKVKGKDAQVALMAGADQIPLPSSPPVEADTQLGSKKEEDISPEEEKKRINYWSYIPSIPSRLPDGFMMRSKRKDQTANDLKAAADTVKSGEGVELNPDGCVNKEAEAEKEKEDLSSILDQLNMSAVNNRVFSFSKESQKLMEDFTIILKDIVNGVPTAYDDLEKLLTNSEGQLKKMYGSLPPFLQTLVKSLPAKFTSSIGPEILAAAAAKPGVESKYAESHLNKPESKGKKSKRSTVPGLKSLVSEKGAVATMLRSILNFLKLRFPAFVTGTNVLMSVAVFLLLFVFWYCHKRGKETRLSSEALAASAPASDAESEADDSESDMEKTVVFEKPEEGVEPAITIKDDPAVDAKPSAAVSDLPSVLDLPEPSSVPLPPPEEADKGLKEAPVESDPK